MIAPVDATAGAALPPEIRAAGTSAQEQYRSALAFERVLLGQVTTAMQSTIGGPEGAGAATEAHKNMLPDTLADAVISGGGLGLASDLVRALRTDRP